MIEVIPTILTADVRELEEKIRYIESIRDEEGNPIIRRVHIDIIDNVFSQSPSIPIAALDGLETELSFDIHLMVKEPVTWVEAALRALPERIIGQVEMMSDQEEFIGRVTEGGVKVGLGVDIGTQTAALDSAALMDTDAVLVMGRKAGWKTEGFSTLALEKIRELGRLKKKDPTPFKVLVDGGVDKVVIKKVREAGADEMAVGHVLFEGEFKGNLEDLLRNAE